MDPSRKLPKTDTQQLLQIVRRRVCTKLPVHHATRNAVDDLLQLPPIRYYLQGYNQKQINAFATHASRYFELYHPSGCIEIAHTSRYSHRTGKSELCILATRPLTPGQVITELKGSMANLTEEEDKELKRTDIKNIDIRRDFSVIHSKQMKKNHLFLGPARFVNHDCDNNCELFREGKYITFRVIRPIAVGDEITAHYGDGYFGRKNRHCLCETCERNGRGGYNPDHRDSDDGSGSDSDSDSDLGDSGTSSDSDFRRGNKKPSENININERRTRRGVYATVIQEDSSDEESEDDGETSTPLPPPKLEEETPEMDSPRLIASVTISTGLMTPDPDTSLPASRSSPLTPVSPSSTHDAADMTPSSARSTPMFRSIIATRRQKAREAENSSAVTQSATPPLTDDTESRPGKSRTPVSRRSVSTRAATPSANLRSSKGKEKASTPSVVDKGKGKETKVKKEEPESRILRARPSAASLLPEDSSSSKPQPICGPDGKPLPMCGTCNNVLPLISVDHKVVWGLEEGSKKSKAKRDCPRCLRHLAIYGQLWPHRIPSAGGSSIPTPKEVTPVPSTSRGQAKSSTSSLSEAKKKYTAKLTAKSGQRRQRDEEAEEPPSKKRKVEKLDIPKPKVEMSVKAKKELLKSTAAARMKTYGRGRSRLSLPNLSLSDIPKRKRGRPRLSPSGVEWSFWSEGRGDKEVPRQTLQANISAQYPFITR
ncbi:hypothetical protein ONZ45_g14241 [Pleurotus djamor]|nr:hypothetical protein ONZ45_g14241 [Pleurotus djamor]